jgi:sugar phosphate permease
MPVFVRSIAPQAVVFAIFVVNSGGAVLGYALAGRASGESTGKSRMVLAVLARSLLAFILLGALRLSSFDVALTTVVLTFMGFLFAVIMVRILSLSMELIPAGKAGLINVLIGLGGAVGSLVGPLMATVGFFDVFVGAGAIFFAAFVFFNIF